MEKTMTPSITAGQIGKIQELLAARLRKSGFPSDLVQRVIETHGDELTDKFVASLQRFVNAVTNTLKVVVYYGKPLTEMVEGGEYDWVNSDITQENFPVIGQGNHGQETEILLFHFGMGMTSESVIAEMDMAGYRPAFLPELLALGGGYPDLQEQYPVVALGSVWHYPGAYRCVPCLYWGAAGRCLDLRWLFKDDWAGCCRFAAVRK